jgi:hypothetical protein
MSSHLSLSFLFFLSQIPQCLLSHDSNVLPVDQTKAIFQIIDSFLEISMKNGAQAICCRQDDDFMMMRHNQLLS